MIISKKKLKNKIYLKKKIKNKKTIKSNYMII